MKSIALFGILAGVAGTLCAQENPKVSFVAGAGFTTPVGRTSNMVDTGWNVRGGVGYNFSPHIGAMVDIGYDSMGVSSPTLTNLGFGGGSLSVFSVTLNPVVHLLPKGSTDIYITGGGGYYRQNQDFTQPGVANGVGFDPFFGFYPYAAAVDIVVASYSVNKPEWTLVPASHSAGSGVGSSSRKPDITGSSLGSSHRLRSSYLRLPAIGWIAAPGHYAPGAAIGKFGTTWQFLPHLGLASSRRYPGRSEPYFFRMSSWRRRSCCSAPHLPAFADTHFQVAPHDP